uniref:AAA domain-containing protein n=1 Tax=Hemiselmis andersenii TaxID=464988 RepID=A0A6T8HSD6_HEMAN|mmetsp:Transcript_27927/g.65058  ORF Transcript_27927/g.65058 Transcript_27927/m.65058 type:complete len:323 (-) Transcript_27927:76-1044(-)
MSLSGNDDPRWLGNLEWDDHHSVPMIVYYNQKGGIGKTTNLHAHGRSMAQSFGLRVMAADLDSQRNMTYDMCGDRIRNYQGGEGQPGFYKNWINRRNANQAVVARTLKQMLEPLYGQQSTTTLADVELEQIEVEGAGELWVLCGDEDITELDNKINTATVMLETLPTLKNYLAAPYYAIMKAAKKCRAQVVLLDLSPSNGNLNKVMTLTSSHIVIPMTLDIKSLEGLVSICERLTDGSSSGWCHWGHFEGVRKTSDCTFTFPTRRPKFLGWTLNNYNVNKRGERVDCVRQDRLARNDEGFFQRICGAVTHCVVAVAKLCVSI